MKANEFYRHLTQDILPFWNRMKDEKNGGFYGFADANGVPDKRSDKGVLLNSRILWFYSAAFRFLTEYGADSYSLKALKESADHAFRFLTDFCYDKENGGLYWTVKADGAPADDTKYTYNIAFAIYALSAYYEAFNNPEALLLANRFFLKIEMICKDEKGYLEAFDRCFRPTANDALSENGVIAERTMNTLLHAMESYTELYRAGKSAEVAAALKQILEAFRTIVYNPETQSCEVFFDDDFHSLIDLQSYGHDIETSWLIKRACDVLQDEQVSLAMRPVIQGLAESAYKNGLDRNVWVQSDSSSDRNKQVQSGGCSGRSYWALNYECENGKTKKVKSWWPQSEAIIGFYNAYQEGAEDYQEDAGKYLEASEKIWEFVRANVIDPKTGEWIEDIGPDGKAKPDQPLVHLWKCPYHTGRMCMEMCRRLSCK